MSVKRRGLGRGLNELLSTTLGAFPQAMSVAEENAPLINGENNSQLQYLTLDSITPGPFQPRQYMQPEALEQLAESIRVQGVLQPIVVRPVGNNFEIIAGERRFRAAQLINLAKLPAIVCQVNDNAAMAIALIENIQRENLNPIEEAQAFKRIIDKLQLTHLQVAEAVGKSRASITNALRLLSLHSQVQNFLEQGQLEMGHARALLALKDSMQQQMAHTIVRRGLSVRETERLVARLQNENLTAVPAVLEKIDPNIHQLQNSLSDKLGAPVNIRHSRKGQGTLIIKYHTVDELEGILAHFS